MRTCIRCGSEMREKCTIMVELSGYGIVLSKSEEKMIGGRLGKPKVAICPACGEVSMYLENVEKLK